MGFLVLGGVIAAALFETGRFTHGDSLYVWGILAGSAVGLLAGTLGRLYSSAYYALRDTRTPLRFAIVRVALTTALGYLCAIPLPRWIGIQPRWGVAGLTASAGVAAWVEFLLLRRTLNTRIGRTGLAAVFIGKLWLSAALAAVSAWGVNVVIQYANPIVAAVPILSVYGAVYFAITFALRIEECSVLLARLGRADR
jgi:putative peptidoglycan lipid II flippase